MLVNLTDEDVAAIRAARDAVLRTSGGKPCRVADAIGATVARIERQTSDSASPPKAGDDPLIRIVTEIQDWRISDNAAVTEDDIEAIEELTSEGQRRPWTLEVSQADVREALWIKALAPDGTQRFLSVEVDQGNLTALAFCDEDEALVKIYLSDGAAYAMEMRSYGRHPDIENEILEFGGDAPFRRRPGPPPPATLAGIREGRP